MQRTSDTHPLELDFIPCGPGRVGMTSCPGVIEAATVEGRWNRDLEVDLERIADKGCATLLSLVEAHEFEKMQISPAALEYGCESRQMDWLWMPVRDMAIPDLRFERKWQQVREALKSQLANDRTLVIHCKAGLGRTGTVAAILLQDLGFNSADAVTTVRKVRPGTIETQEQLTYVNNYVPLS